jgi:hypothetical protein
MGDIGPPIAPGLTFDWDHIEELGSFSIFSDARSTGEFVLRCVVWYDVRTGEIVGHNFDYTRVGCSGWWTVSEAATPEGCLSAIHPASRLRAERAVTRFRDDICASLDVGRLPFIEAPARRCEVPRVRTH